MPTGYAQTCFSVVATDTDINTNSRMKSRCLGVMPSVGVT